MLLQDRVALITGAGRGLGQAVAVAYARQGARVIVTGRTPGELEHTAGLIRAAGGHALALAVDVADDAAMAAMAGEILDRYGRLDVLVNNASTFYPTPVGTITAAQFEDLVGTNLRAPLFLAQAAAPALRETRGLILNMVDIHAERPLRNHPVYSAAKAGLVMLTKSLARELGPEVRVNGIAPGPVMWPERDLPADLKAEIIGKTALQRSGSPEDIARTALFFAAEAPYVTGQVIAVDGGRSI
jgi:pteridine reductase